MDRNKYDNNDKNLFHSNGFAEVASKGNIGSTGDISFTQRQAQNFNRRIVAGYNRSSLGMTYGAVRAKAVSDGDRAIKPAIPYVKRVNGISGNGLTPPVRKYNPFA